MQTACHRFLLYSSLFFLSLSQKPSSHDQATLSLYMSHTQEHPFSLYTHSPSNSFSSLLESFLPSQLHYKHQSPTIFLLPQLLSASLPLHPKDQPLYLFSFWQLLLSLHLLKSSLLAHLQHSQVPSCSCSNRIPHSTIFQNNPSTPPLSFPLLQQSSHPYLSHTLHPQHLCFSSPSA